MNHHTAGQDKTINNALLALYRQDEALEHVEALMARRGIPKPKCVHDRPLGYFRHGVTGSQIEVQVDQTNQAAHDNHEQHLNLTSESVGK
ncbi:hypothetical protein OCA8868_01542 [Octadecabacter ascidiaceicola]|uniref:Uncharacterized protein n=1 Tax=Octadecabacter ascidiaceicola TaxID=1655543 RepID=A0A238K4B5_9RHOB|nr:hypothetical protein OCA8868_01542 [Octadecabacter ascidiaceicola]